jgi:hypothetical protein
MIEGNPDRTIAVSRWRQSGSKHYWRHHCFVIMDKTKCSLLPKDSQPTRKEDTAAVARAETD